MSTWKKLQNLVPVILEHGGIGGVGVVEALHASLPHLHLAMHPLSHLHVSKVTEVRIPSGESCNRIVCLSVTTFSPISAALGYLCDHPSDKNIGF